MEYTDHTQVGTAERTLDIAAEKTCVTFDWDYEGGRECLLKLYHKAKDKQWDARVRIDWSREVNPDNPLGIPDMFVPIYGSPVWNRLTEKEKGRVRGHGAAWQFSQFLHGEQGALMCAARIVEQMPHLDGKYYAATQVMDEARHVEAFSRYLREKLTLRYPINSHLRSLLEQVLSESRWDFVCLGMQILIEGLALGAFATIRDLATEPTARELSAYVMQDEARHVAFGRLALRDYYPQLTESERHEREEFAVEACYLMRDRFLGEDVWRTLDYDAEECIRHVRESEAMRAFRRSLFMRIVPTLKDIGLWGENVQKAFVDMEVMEFADLDPERVSAQDEAAADRLERELRGAECAA